MPTIADTGATEAVHVASGDQRRWRAEAQEDGIDAREVVLGTSSCALDTRHHNM